VTLFEEILGA